MASPFKHDTDIGQNFLRDRSVVEWIVARAGITEDDSIIEIGPGDGALTSALLASPAARVAAIEIDRRLAPFLEPLGRDPRFDLIWGDAVRYDYRRLEATKVIANLPYHITTPVIARLLEDVADRARYMLLMVQLEAAQRLSCGAGSRESCPLGVTISAIGEAVIARRVPRGAFAPQPRVDSAIVEIKISDQRPHLPNDPSWRRLLAGSFAQRRKTLVNNWRSSFRVERERSEELLRSLSLPTSLRPEEASLDDWLAFHKAEIAR